MSLPNDIARCAGVFDDGWRVGCEHCLRRTSPGGRVHMEPPGLLVFGCDYEIEQGGRETLRPEEK